MLRWLRVPYVVEEDAAGNPRRRCALDLHPEIVERGGWWSEIDMGGWDGDVAEPAGWALALVRAEPGLAAALGREFEPVSDPETVVRSALSDGVRLPKRLGDVVADVWDDETKSSMVAIADELAARADIEGYVRISGLDWPVAARLLVMLGERGYGLDRVSTGTFPTRGVLDAFDRPDSSTLGDNWSGPWVTGNRCRISSNQVATKTGTNWSDDYWTPGGVEAVFGDSEAYVTVATKPAGNWYAAELCMRMREPGSTVDCYTVDYKHVAAGQDVWEAYRVDNHTYTQLGATVYAELADGDGVGGEIIGSTITVYHRQGSTWTARLTRTDATYTIGRIGLYMEGEDTRLDNFGGGSVGGGGAVTDGGAVAAATVNAAVEVVSGGGTIQASAQHAATERLAASAQQAAVSALSGQEQMTVTGSGMTVAASALAADEATAASGTVAVSGSHSATETVMGSGALVSASALSAAEAVVLSEAGALTGAVALFRSEAEAGSGTVAASAAASRVEQSVESGTVTVVSTAATVELAVEPGAHQAAVALSGVAALSDAGRVATSAAVAGTGAPVDRGSLSAAAVVSATAAFGDVGSLSAASSLSASETTAEAATGAATATIVCALTGAEQTEGGSAPESGTIAGSVAASRVERVAEPGTVAVLASQGKVEAAVEPGTVAAVAVLSASETAAGETTEAGTVAAVAVLSSATAAGNAGSLSVSSSPASTERLAEPGSIVAAAALAVQQALRETVAAVAAAILAGDEAEADRATAAATSMIVAGDALAEAAALLATSQAAGTAETLLEAPTGSATALLTASPQALVEPGVPSPAVSILTAVEVPLYGDSGTVAVTVVASGTERTVTVAMRPVATVAGRGPVAVVGLGPSRSAAIRHAETDATLRPTGPVATIRTRAREAAVE